MFTAGDQEPETPLIDVAGNGGSASPEQIGPTGANDGTTPEFTAIVSCAVAAHWPAAGVKV